MYLASVNRPAAGRADRTKRLAGTVLALGTVSLITDVSSEMVTAILPLYLIAGLGLGTSVYGVIDGLYTGATALLRLVGGYVADRAQRRKTVAGLGYGLSAVMKFGLLAAGSSVPWISAAIVADRAGKGLRTAPRDALITLATPAGQLGRAFGVHRAMDTAGAFAGPLVALAVLAAAGRSYDSVFVVSGCIALIGVLVLALFVRDHRDPRSGISSGDRRGVREPRANAVSLVAAAALLRRRSIRMLLGGAVLLGLSTVGDGFVYLLLQRRESLATGWFPLLAVGTSLAYLLLAVPLGNLADRVGRAPVVLGGYAALVLVYLLLGSGPVGPLAVIPVLFLYGVYYAATDGVLMALAGPLLPAELRTTGLALVQTGQALAYLVSSVLFGLAWQWWDASGAIHAAALFAVLALPVSALLLRSTRER